MAETVLMSYKRALLNDAVGLNLTTAGQLKVVLVTSSHSLDTDLDEFLDDISGANVVMTSDAFTGIVAATGANLDAADGVSITDPNNGRTSSQGFLFYDTGVESTSRLLMHDDALVHASDAADDTLNFNASGIFDL